MKRLTVLAGLALAACGAPSEGDTVTYEGQLVRAVEGPVSLKTDDRKLSLLGTSRGFRVGDEVRVTGEWAE